MIEVLVALAIVGLVMTAIFAVFGNGSLGHETAGAVDEALSVADAKLDAAGVAGTLHPGQTEGVFADRFRWRLVVAPYEDKDRYGAAVEPVAPRWRLFRVEVSVAWNDGRGARQISLATLRLVPVAP